jgi:hypothetical protein
VDGLGDDPGDELAVTDPALTFINLAKRALAAFELTESEKPGGPGKRMNAFYDGLSLKRPAMNPELERARDDLRDFIEKTAFNHGGIGLKASMLRLRKEVANSRKRHEDDFYYVGLFEHAAHGISGFTKQLFSSERCIGGVPVERTTSVLQTRKLSRVIRAPTSDIRKGICSCQG